MEKLFLIDAYALIYRSYYAFINRPMRNSEGVNTSPVFGFTRYIRDIIRREKPHYLGVAFDAKGATFRHELYPLYKANRIEAPEDIHASVPYIKEILRAMRIPILEVAGWEADDIIGTLSSKADAAGFEVFMVTPDKDFGQLVSPNVHMYKQLKSGEGVEVVDMAGIKKIYGIDDPKLVIDILALWGDASDNIPGVPGIGEKGAIKLVNQFGDVDKILENVDSLSPKLRENLLASRDQLMLSKRLATIDLDAPVEFAPKSLVLEGPDCDALRAIYAQMDFKVFIREMDSDLDPTSDKNLAMNGSGVGQGGGDGAIAPSPQTPKQKASLAGQGSLFGDNNMADASSVAVRGASTPAPQNPNSAASLAGYSGEMDTLADVAHTYHTVGDEQQLGRLIDMLSTQEEFAFDTETLGFDIFNDRMVGISFCVKAFEAWYVPFDRVNTPKYVEMLKPLFANEAIAKIGQNIKFDIMVLANLGIEVRGFKYDTMILHYLIDSESRHGMNYLANTYLNYAPIEIESLIGRGAKQVTMDMVQPDRVAEYGAEDADVTMRLKEVLWPKIVSEELAELYTNIEEPMIDVLAQVEMTGVKIDTDILAQSSEELSHRLEQIERDIRTSTDEPELNVNSPRQLGEVLFTKLRLDPKPRLTKTKQFRTDEEYLQFLSDRSPIIAMILEYRGLKKLLSTYIQALPLLINPKTGRVHTSYNQAVASTGRLSSSNPNLQNIPIREEQGRAIRKAFIPTSGDYLLLSADYSQVELRLMAHLSEDENMLDAFHKGEDIHSATASLLFGVALSDVSEEQRRRAKTANFGIIYGISPFGLSQRLSIPRAEAKEIIDGYFVSYPGVKAYMDMVIEQARDKGYVETIFGRKRWLADIRSSNAVARGLAERNAINAPIQGSAADIMKLAMIAVVREFREAGLRSRVIMQVHDELVVDMYKPEEDVVRSIVTKSMEGAAQLKVALTADCGVGKNWIEAH